MSSMTGEDARVVSDVDKLAVTLTLVFAALIIAALVSVLYWYFSLAKRKKRKKDMQYRGSLDLRSLEEIEEELRDIERISASTDLTKDGKKLQPPNQLTQPLAKSQAIPSSGPAHSEVTSSAGNDSTSLSSTDLQVIRCDPQQQSKEDNSSQVRLRSLIDTHIGSRADRSNNMLVNAGYLPDSRISNVSVDSEETSTATSDYGGVLWPDVIDPYHRAHELEHRIGKRAVNVHSRNSQSQQKF